MNQTILMHQPSAWDEFSTTYEALAEPMTSQFGSALTKRLGIRRGERIVDIAAGSGALTLELARLGAEVTAVDHSESLRARIAARADAEGLGGRVQARTMDGQALQLPDGHFDVGLSVFGIMLFPDPDAGLSELVRVLRPGGRAGLAVWSNPEGAAPALLLTRAARALWPGRPLPPRPPGIDAWSNRATLDRSMVDAGLKDVVVVEMSVEWLFPSVQWVVDNGGRLFGMMPIWSEADEADRSRLLDHMVGQLTAADSLAIASPAWLATGVKPG